MNSPRLKIVVVGAGLSGLMAAIKAAALGADVSLVTRTFPMRSRSAWIAGGINAATDISGESDSIACHVSDTLNVGNDLNSKQMVEAMCKAAPAILDFFERAGVFFDRTNEGLIAAYPSNGSSKKRTAYAGDNTSMQLMRALTGQLARLSGEDKIHIYENFDFQSLVIEDGVCSGIVAANLINMEMKAFEARAVILCAGGYSGLFGNLSTSPASDGFAIARSYEQGAVFANPEFVELYPYCVKSAGKVVAFDSRNFLSGGNNDKIQTAPGFHTTLGGLKTDAGHATNIKGLFAAGGAVAGYHGAGILDGNEFLALAYGGETAAAAAFEFASKMSDGRASIYEKAILAEEDRNAAIAKKEGEENIHNLDRDLSKILAHSMWIERDSKDIDAAITTIGEIKEKFKSAPILDKSQWANSELLFAKVFDCKLKLARLVLEAARRRNESRGVHNKAGFAGRDDKKWKVVTKASYSYDGPVFDYSEKV